VAAGGEPKWRNSGHAAWGGQRAPRRTELEDTPAPPAVTPQEQQWAAQQVRQHLEQQAGQERPAEYGVERTKDGYRVFVQYVQLDEQGQPTDETAGSSSVRLSRRGQVLEVISGM
jgi:hypothetical protein